MQIVETNKVSLLSNTRTGYSTMLVGHLNKMKPGQSLLLDVDFSDIEGMTEEELTAFASDNEISLRPGEELPQSVSRWLANRQRTRTMASLDKEALNPAHYYSARLVAPNADGIVEKIAIVCAPADERPARKKRVAKPKK